MATQKNVTVGYKVSTKQKSANNYLVTRKMTSKSSVKVTTKGSRFVVERKHLITDGK